MKRIAILGSTGSIGRQTLDIIRDNPKEFEVVALAGGNNIQLLKDQVLEFKPGLVYSHSEFGFQGTRTVTMEEMAGDDNVDLVVVATTGQVGMSPTLSAIRAGKDVALANKEVLVMAGKIITEEASKYNAQLFPIDSEHSAIWQCLKGENNGISRLILTASGGPFKDYSLSDLCKVTPEKALNHPTWNMGSKVTIDSATLMNKGLEAIEARWLFSVPIDNIEIVVHPKSIVHSLVEFVDGSVKAQLSMPDMRLPIQYALSFPARITSSFVAPLNLIETSPLTFEPVNYEKFPCLILAMEAGKKNGTYPAVLCAADEMAVGLFLGGRIGFTDIAGIIEETLNCHHGINNPDMEEIAKADAWAREVALNIASKDR